MTEKCRATREGTNLPNNEQFHPDSHKSRQRAKGLQDIRVVTTRFLNACSQLSIAEGTCENETEASQEISRNTFPNICKVNNQAAIVTQQLLIHSNPTCSLFKRVRSFMSFRWTCVSHGTKCLQARCLLLTHTGVAHSAASCQQCKALWHTVVSKYCPVPSSFRKPASSLEESLNMAFLSLLSHGKSKQLAHVWKQESQVEDFPHWYRSSLAHQTQAMASLYQHWGSFWFPSKQFPKEILKATFGMTHHLRHYRAVTAHCDHEGLHKPPASAAWWPSPSLTAGGFFAPWAKRALGLLNAGSPFWRSHKKTSL